MSIEDARKMLDLGDTGVSDLVGLARRYGDGESVPAELASALDSGINALRRNRLDSRERILARLSSAIFSLGDYSIDPEFLSHISTGEILDRARKAREVRGRLGSQVGSQVGSQRSRQLASKGSGGAQIIPLRAKSDNAPGRRKNTGKDAKVERSKTAPRVVVRVSQAEAATRLGVAQYVVRDLFNLGSSRDVHVPLTELETFEHLSESDSSWKKRVTDHARARREERKEAQRRETDRIAGEREKISTARTALGLSSTGPDWLAPWEVGVVLGLSPNQVRGAIHRGDLPAYEVNVKTRYGRENRWNVQVLVVADIAADPPEWLVKARHRRSVLDKAGKTPKRRDGVAPPVPPLWTGGPNPEGPAETNAQSRRAPKVRPKVARKAERKAEKRKIELLADTMSVQLFERRVDPTRVVAHLGPTNSGKTHDALEALITAGNGTYAAPLRMLAQEAYERLRAATRDDVVGLVTGEERINPDAPILCCTAEMAPMTGELLVLDELHWAADPERGPAWTRLLVGGSYEEIRLCGAPDALPLATAAFPESEILIHDRLGPLGFAGKVQVAEVPSGTVVVAFSRKAVLGLAREIDQHQPGRVAVLYGAMPPGARRVEIARFTSGSADVIVATDVIGHGINMPAKMVCFAETSKFDGSSRRPLESWEIAQIAGRAGRFSMAGAGDVTVLSGHVGFSPDASLVERSLVPRTVITGDVMGHRVVRHAIFGPRLADFDVNKPSELVLHLKAFELAGERVSRSKPWLRAVRTTLMRQRLDVVKTALGGDLDRISIDDAWRLCRAPADPDRSDAVLLGSAAKCICSSSTSLRPLLNRIATKNVRLEDAEDSARLASLLRWFTLAFPGIGGITHAEATAAEEQASEQAARLVERAIRTNRYGRCGSCGALCPPWFSECDRCHSHNRYDRYDSWDRNWYRR